PIRDPLRPPASASRWRWRWRKSAPAGSPPRTDSPRMDPPHWVDCGCLARATASRRPRRSAASPRSTARASRAGTAFAPRPVDLAPRVAFGDRVALVVGLLATRERDQELGAAARGEIHLERDQGQALLRDAALELADLARVQEQLAPAHRVPVPAVALL